MANDIDMHDETAEATFRAFLRVSGLIRHVMEPFFAKFGISGAQWGVLRALGRAQDQGELGLRLTDIGERLLIRPPSVTGVVDRLQRMGLVERTSSSEDGRTKHVRLTAGGRELLGRVKTERDGKIDNMLGGLLPQEQLQLKQLLHRLGIHLESLAGHGIGSPAPGQ